MRYEFKWERAIGESTKRNVESNLRALLDHALFEHRNEHSVTVKLIQSPHDPFDEEIIGEVWCGDALLGQARGTTQRLDWFPTG